MTPPAATWVSTGVRSVRRAQGLFGEVEQRSRDVSPILVGGAPTAAADLARLLAEGGDQQLVRRAAAGDLAEPRREAVSALVYVVRESPTPTDERALRAAAEARIPLVCVVLARGDAALEILPYVLATDVVLSAHIDARTAERAGERIAARAPDAWALARRLPALRRPAARELVRRDALHAAELAVSDPGPYELADLALGQAATVLRLGAATGARGGVLPAAILAAGAALVAQVGSSRAAADGLVSRLVPASTAALAALVAGSAATAWLFRTSSGGGRC